MTLAVLCCAAMSCNLKAENISTLPDLPALQNRVATLVAQEWLKWYRSFFSWSSNAPISDLKQVEIRMVCRADSLLTDIPLRQDKVNPLKDNPVYLVKAVADTGFWQTTTEHVLVIQHGQSEWKTLLHFFGGSMGRGMDMQLIDLGVSSSRQAIQIEDYACGNQMDQTRTHMFRWNKKANRFDKVFNQLTTWLPSATPLVYESTLSLEGSNSDLKDVVIHTKFIRQDDAEDKPEPPTITVFKWDGKTYVGRMKKPPGTPD